MINVEDDEGKKGQEFYGEMHRFPFGKE